jgi:hypothetical protein
MWPFRTADTSHYLRDGRLPDVLALIQVLAADSHAHRSESGLNEELQGKPQSAETWTILAKKHPEFFRVKPDGEHRVSLIARHVIERTEGVRPVLPPDYTSKLLQLAVELHDRAVKRSQHWHIWVPIMVALTAGIFTLLGAYIKVLVDK